MKRFSRLCLIVGAVCLAAGAVLSAVGCAAGAIGDIRTSPAGTEETLDVPAEQLTQLNISLSSEDVLLQPSPDGDLHISYTPQEDRDYRCELTDSAQDGTQTYSFSSTLLSSGVQWPDLLKIQIWSNSSYPTVTIYLPEQVSVHVATTSGDVRAQNITAAALQLSTTSGDVFLSEFSVLNLDASATSGDVTLRDGTLDGNATLSTASGETELAGLEIGGALQCGSTSGDMELSAVTVASAVSGAVRCDTASGDISMETVSTLGGLSLNSTSGDISLEAATVCRDIYAESTSGDISIHLAGAPAHRADTSTHSGSVEVSGCDSSGPYVLSVSTTSGDIHLVDTNG